MPFTLKLKNNGHRLLLDGMPSRFASEVEVTDPIRARASIPPSRSCTSWAAQGHDGLPVVLDDGGSTVLKGYPLVGTDNATFNVERTVGSDC